jgi:subtilase family serine protease
MTFFIVSDATADSVQLGTRALGALGAGATSTLATSLKIPATLPVPAAYRVMAVLDSAQQQTELDESNNTLTTSSIAVTAYRPELTVTNITLPATAQAGRPLAIRHTVRNAGPAPAGAFAVRFFLSADDVLDAGDALLGARSIGALAAGASSTAITTLKLPGDTSVPGTYRVIALVDALEQATELDETNNAAVSSPVPVTAYRPDLTISALKVPATAQAGRPLAITHTIRNLGPAPAGAFVIRFYLSAGDVLDPGDVLLGTRSVAALGAGASSAAITSVTVPVTTAVPVSYRVIAVADALEQQVELDESNNVTTSAPLALTAYRPEILITAIGAPAVAQAGRPMTISHTVRNAGPAPAGPFVIRFFLSADDRADAGDVLLGTRVVGGLGAGLSSAANMSMVVPVTVAAGAYRIVAVADAAGQQAELDETNDAAVSAPLTVAR